MYSVYRIHFLAGNVLLLTRNGSVGTCKAIHSSARENGGEHADSIKPQISSGKWDKPGNKTHRLHISYKVGGGGGGGKNKPIFFTMNHLLVRQ